MDNSENQKSERDILRSNPSRVGQSVQKTPTYAGFKNPKLAYSLISKLYTFTGYGDFKKAYAVQRFCKKALTELKTYPEIVRPYYDEKNKISALDISQEEKEKMFEGIIERLETEIWSKPLSFEPWVLKREDVEPILSVLAPIEIEALSHLLSEEI